MSPALDDPITFVLYTASAPYPEPVPARVELYHDRLVAAHGYFRCALTPAAEGVFWIRGHHTGDSEEGAALLTAYALVCGT